MKHMKHATKMKNKLRQYDAHFLEKLAHLLENGFTQKDALLFLIEQYEVLKTKDKEILLVKVKNGKDIENILKFLGYKNSILAQIRFAKIHGEVVSNLFACSAYLKKKRATLKGLLKALQYPMVLVSIFIVILIVLNYTVIPQFNTLYDSMGTSKSVLMIILTTVLSLLPKIVLLFMVIAVILSMPLYYIFISKNISSKQKVLLKLPVFNTYYQYFVTYKFSREIGFMFNNGIESKEIIHILKEQDLDSELQYLGAKIEKLLLQGYSISSAISEFPILDKRLITFVKHGEHNSNVGKELIIYSEYVLENIIFKIEKLTRQIQPIIFVILGFLVICLYLVIVLPVFQMMSELN